MAADVVSEWVPPPLHQFDAGGFVLPPFEASKFPFVVAVAGVGQCP